MEKWIIPCNPNYYDVLEAFNEFDNINWKQSIDIQVGDTVYIYVSKPVRAIKIEAMAVKVDLDKPTINDHNYVIDGSRYECQHRFKNVVFHRFKKCRFSAVRRCCFSPASAEKQRGTVFFHRSITEDRPVFFSWNAARVPACSLSCDMSFR